MAKTANKSEQGIEFKQGLQLFFVRKILDERYTMASVAGSEQGIDFFVQWSQIVRKGKEEDPDFPCSIAVPSDFGESTAKEAESTWTEEVDLSFAPEPYHPLLKNQRFAGLWHLLRNTDLGRLMQISYPAAVKEVVAVIGPTRDVDIVREAVARQLGKKPEDLTDEDYRKVQELSLFGGQISSLELPKGLTSLQGLDLSNTRVSNLEPLKDLASLQRLDLDNTKVSNLEPLKGLSSLQRLDLVGTKVSNLEPLKGLASLQGLYLYNTKVSNLEPLKNLASLQSLNLGITEVSNLEPLKGLISLQRLNLSNTEVSNLEPLKGLTSLQELSLSYTKVSKKQVAELQKALPKVEISR